MKKDKKLLSYEEGKKLFDKLSLDTLDSIDLLYDAAEQESPTSFSVIFDKKYEEEVNKGNFEGRNEITRGTRIDNFDITEITDKFDELTKKERKYIMLLIEVAIDKINPDQPEFKIIPKLAECVKTYAETVKNETTILSCGMTIGDLEHFFKKFNLAELEVLEPVLVYNDHPDIEEIRKIKEKVHNTKIMEASKPGSYRARSTRNSVRINDLQRKNYKLTNKELGLFHDLVEITASYLDSIELYEEEYQSQNEEFDACYYPLSDQVYSLLDSIEEELKNRGIGPEEYIK